ncbi:hypothetical protein A8M80_25415 [Escherichia coli]|nr:hypothetical protein A8M80_25415 [Escherichia coli]
MKYQFLHILNSIIKMGHRQIKQYHFIIIVLIIQRIEVNHQIGLQEQRAILKLNWIKRLSLISL